MKKNHFIIPVISAALLSGCSEGAKSSVSSYMTTAAAEATETEPATTKPVVTIATPPRKKDETIHFTVGVDGSKVTVLRGGSAVSVLELDEPLPNGADDVVTGDFDFDGYDDLFIYDDILTGDYWLCNPDTMEFSRCDALALADGRAVLMERDSSKKTLTLERSENEVSTVTVYKWQGSTLAPVSAVRGYYTYTDEGYEKTEDVFEYDDTGRELLTERRHINLKTDACFSTETDVVYFRRNENGLEYMKGRETVQTIETAGPEQLYDRIVQNGRAGELRVYGNVTTDPVESLWQMEDYDFDGHEDLQIQTDSVLAGGSDKYVYYRYDAEKDRYTEWQELNAFDCYISANSQTQTIQYYDEHTLDEDHNRYTYKWDNGKLRLTERTFYHGDSNQCDIYEYDEDGNEHYISTNVYIKEYFG